GTAAAPRGTPRPRSTRRSARHDIWPGCAGRAHTRCTLPMVGPGTVGPATGAPLAEAPVPNATAASRAASADTDHRFPILHPSRNYRPCGVAGAAHAVPDGQPRKPDGRGTDNGRVRRAHWGSAARTSFNVAEP